MVLALGGLHTDTGLVKYRGDRGGVFQRPAVIASPDPVAGETCPHRQQPASQQYRTGPAGDALPDQCRTAQRHQPADHQIAGRAKGAIGPKRVTGCDERRLVQFVSDAGLRDYNPLAR
jgi:hypothetical protein